MTPTGVSYKIPELPLSANSRHAVKILEESDTGYALISGRDAIQS